MKANRIFGMLEGSNVDTLVMQETLVTSSQLPTVQQAAMRKGYRLLAGTIQQRKGGGASGTNLI